MPELSEWRSSPGFVARLRTGSRKPGVVVALVAGLGHGLYGREAIESRGVLISVLSALALALLWATAWLVVRTILTKVVDLSRPAVKLGYISGILMVGAVMIDVLSRDDSYVRDHRYVMVSMVVIVTVIVGGLPGMILGQLAAWTLDLRRRRPLPSADPPSTVSDQENRAAKMIVIGEPNARGPLEDALGVDDTDDQRGHRRPT